MQRLAAAANARARQHESERDLLAARHASERRESLERQRAEHAQELNAQLAESQAAQEAQSRELLLLLLIYELPKVKREVCRSCGRN